MQKCTKPNSRAAKREFWQHHIAEQQRSDLTQGLYCDQHGLTLASFSRWRRLFSEERVASDSAFVAVAVETSTSISSGLSITPPNGVRIDGVQASSISTVASLIRAL